MSAISERRASTIALLEKDAKSGQPDVDGADLFEKMPETSQLINGDEQPNQKRIFEEAETERQKIREFRFRVTKVQATFENAIAYPFLRVEFGGIVSEFETEDLRLKKVTVKVRNEEGKMVDEVKETAVFHKAENLIGKRHIFYTPCMKNVKQKVDTLFPCDFGGVWQGTYADLKTQHFRIEIWNRTFFGGNDFVGKYAGRLIDIANGCVDQYIEVEAIASSTKEIVCQLRFKCEFQEIFDFAIDVRSWEIQAEVTDENQLTGKPRYTFKQPMLKFSAPRAPFKDKLSTLLRSVASLLYNHPFAGHVPALVSPLSFWLPYRELPLLTDMSRTWEDTKTICYVSALNKDAPKDVKDNDDGCFVFNDAIKDRLKKSMLVATSTLHYHGTRTDLENESVSVVLNEDSTVIAGHKPFRGGSAFQGILDYGYMSVPLSNGRCGYIAKGEILFRPPGPLYRQTGNLEYASSDAVNMVITVVRGRKLESLVGYQEKLSPSMTVEWNNQQKQTKVLRDTSEPYWNEQLWFRTEIDKDMDKPLPSAYFKTVVTLQCWDNESFSKAPLGYAEIDFLTIYRDRKNFFGRGGKLVYKTNLKLNISDDYGKMNVSPTVEIEVHFVPELKMARLEMTDFLSLQEEAKQVAEAKEKENQDYERALTAWAEVQKTFEAVPTDIVGFRLKRYFHVQGIDEQTGNVYWLPRFIGEVYPPSGLREPEDILHFVSSLEHQHRVTPPRRKQGSHGPALLVWSDPYYLLEKRKGTIRDHAILLCCFLEARCFDAYVAIGSVRRSDNEISEHYWVLTRETKKLVVEGEASRTVNIVRFWETTTGKIIMLEPSNISRWTELKDVDGKWALPVQQKNLLEEKPSKEGDLEGKQRRSRRHQYAPGEQLLYLDVEFTARQSRNISSIGTENFSVFAEQKSALEEFNKKMEMEQKQRLEPLRIPEFDIPTKMPYVSLDVVFNRTHLFANTQSYDPQKISYNFYTQRDRWFEFPFNRDRPDAPAEPFYRKKPLRPKAPSHEIREVTVNVSRIIRVAISQYREFSGDCDAAETNFFPSTNLATIDSRIEIDERFQYDKDLEDPSDTMPVHAKHAEVLNRWRESLLKLLPPGFTYDDKILFFKHSDSSRIADAVVRYCKNLLDLPDYRNPQFIVRVKVQPLPCNVCPVRVLVGAVFKAVKELDEIDDLNRLQQTVTRPL